VCGVVCVRVHACLLACLLWLFGWCWWVCAWQPVCAWHGASTLHVPDTRHTPHVTHATHATHAPHAHAPHVHCRRSKKLTEYEKWEYKQLMMSGVLDPRDYPLFDEEHGMGVLAQVDEVRCVCVCTCVCVCMCVCVCTCVCVCVCACSVGLVCWPCVLALCGCCGQSGQAPGRGRVAQGAARACSHSGARCEEAAGGGVLCFWTAAVSGVGCLGAVWCQGCARQAAAARLLVSHAHCTHHRTRLPHNAHSLTRNRTPRRCPRLT
jgi:hypothetical protein